MSIDWNLWAVPLAVLAVGSTAGVLWTRRRTVSSPERQRVRALGRTEDLAAEKAATLETLRSLELDQDKLDPREYANERQALVARGAAALRALESTSSPSAVGPSPTLIAALESERATLGDVRVNAALRALHRTAGPPPASAPLLSPAWRGALWTLVAVGTLGVLTWFALEDSTTRRAGASMTGNQELSAPSTPSPSSDPEVRAFESRLAENPDDLDALNALTEHAIADRDLQRAMGLNEKAREVSPQDPDAQVHFAFLLAAIGAFDDAFQTLDRVLEHTPEHTKALVYKGLIGRMAGRPDIAVEALETALAGPSAGDPFLTEQLESARAEQRAATASPPPPEATAPPELLVGGTIDLATPTSFPPQAVVFVSVRDPQGGPPLAASKLTAETFPMDFRLTRRDLIQMGRPRAVPPTLNLSIRVDLDGDPMTRESEAPMHLEPGVSVGTDTLSFTLD